MLSTVSPGPGPYTIAYADWSTAGSGPDLAAYKVARLTAAGAYTGLRCISRIWRRWDSLTSYSRTDCTHASRSHK